jgi:xanthine dehydrogenase YagS FAD-binding subunit
MDTASAAGSAAIEGAKPLSMNAYKLTLTRTVVKRALLAAIGNRYWEEA